jgi:hypothetical protein
MFYKTIVTGIVVTLLVSTPVTAAQRRVRPCVVVSSLQEEECVYKKVYDDYSDILHYYYRYEKGALEQKEWYKRQLIGVIVRHVRENRLTLYGNIFSRLWRNIGAEGGNDFPLKKFDSMFIEDALGHIRKKCTLQDAKITDLLRSLTAIRHIVTTSLEYTIETLLMERNRLAQEVSSLKQQLKDTSAECKQLHSRVCLLESKSLCR